MLALIEQELRAAYAISKTNCRAGYVLLSKGKDR